MHGPSRPVVVLLEGQSDVAALTALIAASPLADRAGAVDLVGMGGAANVRRHVDALVRLGRAHRVLGLCDARETGYFLRALAPYCPGITGAGMAAYGFHVCRNDLEDELIRALGTDRVLAVLDDLGLAECFAQFRQQPYWRERPLEAQLRRFPGVASGRKAVLAAALASAAPLASAPAPLRALLRQVEAALHDRPGPAIRSFSGAGVGSPSAATSSA
ncbi:ATP-dependent endonuclease [Georgenia sp. TF02-10]|uniref:ATP-dependent endonuclease n=1 Tax=Georgenia sp. TF02-10 TaxID=2917725 RepID=UPI001FA7A8DC|nr:ATP-dependent endonuclease [Georgenia sp. TF02-10]UNX53183.1 ATP-dependent endonuclease [Georgenia sp. TF02-10]